MKKLKKNITIIIFSFLFCMSIQMIFCQDLLNSDNKQKALMENLESNKVNKKTKYSVTIKRTFLKSISETFWSLLEKCNNTQEYNPQKTEFKIDPLNYYELGKISSILLIDELIENPNPNLKQKYIELLVPSCIASLLINVFHRIKDKKNPLINDFKKLAFTLGKKALMVRFFLKPRTKKYYTANIAALAAMLINPKTIKIDPYYATQQISLDLLKGLIDQVNLRFFLNKKHRTKALGKTTQTLSKPLIQRILYKLLKPAINKYFFKPTTS